MAGDDIEAHITHTAKSFNQLEALITPQAPLTPKDLYAACILTSLPTGWLSCVSSMANKKTMDPDKLIDALRVEYLRRKTQAGDTPSTQSVSATQTGQCGTQKLQPTSTPCYCATCVIDRHNSDYSSDTAWLLAGCIQPRSERTNQAEAKSDQPFPVTKASRALAVSLTDSFQDHQFDLDVSCSLVDVTVGQEAVSLSLTMAVIPSSEVRLDLGSPISMNCDHLSVHYHKEANTPVHLVVEAPHKQLAKLPLGFEQKTSSLVVPSLEEPLLATAGLCDVGLTGVLHKGS